MAIQHPHTPESLAQSAFNAVGAEPYRYGSASRYSHASRLCAAKWAVTAMLENDTELVDPAEYELCLESLLVILEGEL